MATGKIELITVDQHLRSSVAPDLVRAIDFMSELADENVKSALAAKRAQIIELSRASVSTGVPPRAARKF